MTSFEEKMAKLEVNVTALEKGDIPLQKALETYTETMQLAKECEEELNKVREQIVKVVDEQDNITEMEIK